MFWVKNIERIGKTIYECVVTMFPSKKKIFCQISSLEVGASLFGGEFECAGVNPIPEQHSIMGSNRIQNGIHVDLFI